MAPNLTHEIYWSTDAQAYQALRWFCPEAVQLIRAALDNGCSVKGLSKLPEGSNDDMVQAAIRHMAANPKTGRIRWIDGFQWDWLPDNSD